MYKQSFWPSNAIFIWRLGGRIWRNLYDFKHPHFFLHLPSRSVRSCRWHVMEFYIGIIGNHSLCRSLFVEIDVGTTF